MTTPAANQPVWDDEDWHPLRSLEGETGADVCVIGLGGSGLAAIDELRSMGVRVMGIDAGLIGGGAAGRNGGFLLAGLASFHHDAVAELGRERARALYQHTLEQIERMTHETPQVIRRVGSLRIASDTEEAEDCNHQYDVMRTDGLPVERYSGPEGNGLLLPNDGAFHPLKRCRMLALRLLGAGVPLYENTRAIEIGNGLIVTERGAVDCETVIVAVDGGLEILFPELSPRVRTARLQMLATAPTKEVMLPRPVYWRYGMEYWQQLPDGRIALGGFRDKGGIAEWTHKAEPTADVQALLESLLRERIGVKAPITHRWAAPVAFSDTLLPLMQEVRPGVWACGAYSGTGNVVGALTGRAIARMALGQASDWGQLVLGEKKDEKKKKKTGRA